MPPARQTASTAAQHVLKRDRQRPAAERLHHLRMLGVKAAHLVDYGRVLLLGMSGDLLHLLGRDLAGPDNPGRLATAEGPIPLSRRFGRPARWFGSEWLKRFDTISGRGGAL